MQTAYKFILVDIPFDSNFFDEQHGNSVEWFHVMEVAIGKMKKKLTCTSPWKK